MIIQKICLPKSNAKGVEILRENVKRLSFQGKRKSGNNFHKIIFLIVIQFFFFRKEHVISERFYFPQVDVT